MFPSCGYIFFNNDGGGYPELEQRRGGEGGGRFACPTGFSSSVIPFSFHPKLGGGGVECIRTYIHTYIHFI